MNHKIVPEHQCSQWRTPFIFLVKPGNKMNHLSHAGNSRARESNLDKFSFNPLNDRRNVKKYSPLKVYESV